MQARIKRYAAEHQKFFLTYVPAAPHYPYDGTPHRFYKYQKKQIGDFTPLYLNELLYMDWIISSLIDQLRDSGVLDRTLVIITDDHGESLGADGGPIGHGWAVTPDLANVPLIIMDPENRGYHVNYTVGSQVDLTPTILDLLGIPIPGSQLCQGNSLYSVGADTNRTIYLNSYRDYATIKGNLMICGNRETPDAGNATNAFSINNQGARTSFVGTDINDFAPFSISTFDHFQESLLLHYSQYCQIMRQQQAGK
jgi:arylsulfatase A-like enzyme